VGFQNFGEAGGSEERMTTLLQNTQLPEALARRKRHGLSGERAGHSRFTLDGDDALESHLAGVCERVLAGVQTVVPARKMAAILLGGGYGRGEGGVLKTGSGDQPYNDLEFYVCLRGHDRLNEWLYRKPILELAEELSTSAGVEVELKLFSLGKLRRSAVSMFYYDLAMGHRWVQGEEDLLKGCGHHREASRIPLSEATRLLMNRCSGLLFARQKLQHLPLTADVGDFVGRNLAKAKLAFGDVVLAFWGEYHWSCRERQQRLQRIASRADLPWLDAVQEHHRAGVRFKLHPWRSTGSRSALLAQHGEITTLGLKLWLWLESRRLKHSFASAREYALSSVDKCPETNRWRNFLVNGKIFGPTILPGSKLARHPRERLLHALALLLWEPTVLNDAELLSCLQSELRTPARNFFDLVTAYDLRWRHLN
jgi:hypothetical protein